EYDTFTRQDVADWLNFVSLPATRINQLSEIKVSGGVSTPGDGQDEVLLDIDTVMGMAPAATYISYSAPQNTSFATIFNRMIVDNVDVISNSWGDCEIDHARAELDSLDTVLGVAAAAGISVFTAAGDNGGQCFD